LGSLNQVAQYLPLGSPDEKDLPVDGPVEGPAFPPARQSNRKQALPPPDTYYLDIAFHDFPSKGIVIPAKF
jgi:hypothetical protein